MLRIGRLTLLLILLVLLQTALFPHFRILDVVPDLGLVAAVAIAVRYGPELGATFGFVAGFASDAFLQTPLGLSALAFGLTAYVVGMLQRNLARPAWWVNPVVAMAAGILAGALYVGLGALVGQQQLFVVRSVRTILLAAAYDGIVALVIFPVAIAAARPREPATIGAAGY